MAKIQQNLTISLLSGDFIQFSTSSTAPASAKLSIPSSVLADAIPRLSAVVTCLPRSLQAISAVVTALRT